MLKSTDKPTKQEVPGFEQGEDTAAPAGATAEAPKTDPAAAAVEATVAIASASVSSQQMVPHVPRRDLKDFIGALEGRLPPVGFGTSPRIIATQGGMRDGDKVPLGATAEITLLSWNKKWQIRTGESGDTSKELIKFADNPNTFPDGASTADYVKRLKEVEKLPKAELAEYVELVCLLDKTEKPYKHAGSGGIVVVSVAPNSVKNFLAVRRDTSVSYMLNKIEETDMPMLKLNAEAKSAKGVDWTAILFEFLGGAK